MIDIQDHQKDQWETRYNRSLDLTKYIMADKVAHISIEDAGFDLTVPKASVRQLYEDDDEFREVSSITSAHYMEYDKNMFNEIDNDAKSIDLDTN